MFPLFLPRNLNLFLCLDLSEALTEIKIYFLRNYKICRVYKTCSDVKITNMYRWFFFKFIIFTAASFQVKSTGYYCFKL